MRHLLTLVFSLMALGCMVPTMASAANDQLPEFNLLGTAGTSGNSTTYSSMDMTSGEFSGTASIDGEDFTVEGSETGNVVTETYSEDDESYQSYDTIYLTGIGSDGDVVGNGSFTDTNGTSESYSYDLNQPEATVPTTTTVTCLTSSGTVNCKAVVAGVSPTGVVTFSSPSGTFTTDQCVLAGGSCSVSFFPTPGATPSISATYSGDANSLVSQGTTNSILSGTITTVTCGPGSTSNDPGSCTALVASADPAQTTAPSGSVSFSATAGTLADSTCSLTAVGGSTNSSSCSIHYTAPANVTSATVPEVDVSYPGDSTYGNSTGSQQLTCSSGAILQVDSVDSTSPHPNGYRIMYPATISGCGFSAGQTVTFGQGDPSDPLSTTDINGDGTQAIVTIPATSTDGTVVLTQATLTAATASSPQPVTVDNWRNTNGFSFNNFPGSVSASDLLAVFPNDGLTNSYGQLNTDGSFLLSAANSAAKAGVCFGIALTSGELADGYIPASYFGSDAADGFVLPLDSALQQFIVQAFLKQYSWQFTSADNASATQSVFGILGPLDATFSNGNGFTTPVVVGVTRVTQSTNSFGDKVDHYSSHAEVAYGDQTLSQGSTILYTADSNVPFASGENTDASVHQDSITHSWMAISPNGDWVSPDMNMSGGPNRMVVVPVSKLQGPVTLDDPSGSPIPTTIILDPSDTVDSLSNSSGQDLNLAESSDELDIESLFTSNSSAKAVSPSKGASGIGLLGPHSPTTTITLQSTDLGALWRGTTKGSSTANLSGGSGTLVARWSQKTSTMDLATPKGSPSPTSTLTLVDTLNGGEHIATLKGKDAYSAQLTGAGLVISSPKAATLTVSLSSEGSQDPQTTLLAPLHVHGRVVISPKQWSNLNGTSVTLVEKGHRVSLRHHGPTAPKARLTLLKASGKSLRLSLSTPKLLGPDQSFIHVELKVRGAKLTKTIAGSPKGGQVKLAFKLREKPRGKVEVIITTVNGGPSPTTSVVKSYRIG